MMTTARLPRLGRLPILLCLGCGLIPCIAVQGAYLLAAQHGFVDWCNPYIDSCTSISATGRRPPASFVFKGLMLPSAMLMIIFWIIHGALVDTLNEASRRGYVVQSLGIVACVGLVLYVTVLGELGDVWRLQRRIGTILFFSFTFLAQLLLAAGLRSVPVTVHRRAANTARWMLTGCTVMLVIGIFSVLVQAVSEDWHDAIEDAIEWQLALLLQINFFLSVRLWWPADWTLVLQRSES